jgi:hypothetical protein
MKSVKNDIDINNENIEDEEFIEIMGERNKERKKQHDK